MTVTIEKGVARGRILAPPSKSLAHRNLICAALSEKSIISGIDFSQDILATLDCLKALGAKITREGSSVTIGGLKPQAAKSCELDCRESGSTLRFISPLCLLCNEEITLKGSGRLMERPMTVYEELFKEKGIHFYKDNSIIKAKGKLKGGIFKINANISSQFVSGLLFALPLAENDSIIMLDGNIESLSYIHLTLNALKEFGINIDSSDIRNIKIFGSQKYISKNVSVEGDYSNAAFFDALNFIGGSVKVEGLKEDSIQGDKVYKEIMPLLFKDNAKISLADCPDLGPILFCLAAIGNGAYFTDTKRLRIKESDRVLSMEEELNKFGVKMDIEENSVRVYSGVKAPKTPLCSHNDHRIAMALSVLCTVTGGTITGAQAVSKSLPDFFERLSGLQIKVIKNEA